MFFNGWLLRIAAAAAGVGVGRAVASSPSREARPLAKSSLASAKGCVFGYGEIVLIQSVQLRRRRQLMPLKMMIFSFQSLVFTTGRARAATSLEQKEDFAMQPEKNHLEEKKSFFSLKCVFISEYWLVGHTVGWSIT